MVYKVSIGVAFIVLLACHWYLLKRKKRTPILDVIAWVLNIASIIYISVSAYTGH